VRTWFQALRQRQPASVRPPGGREESARVWLVGSFILVGCVLALLVYQSGARPESPKAVQSVSGEAGVEPGSPAARAIVRRTFAADRHEAEGAAVDAADADPTPVQVVDAAPVEPLALDPTSFTDPATLTAYLRTADPVLGAAVFHAVSRRDKEMAMKALLDIVTDPAEPRRLQALELLRGGSDADEETVNAALWAALQDPDSALVTYAVQELGARSDASSLGLLAEALNTGEPATKLLIVQSIASNSSADSLLHQGARDSDETVRSAAKAVLSLRAQSKPAAEEAL